MMINFAHIFECQYVGVSCSDRRKQFRLFLQSAEDSIDSRFPQEGEMRIACAIHAFTIYSGLWYHW